MSKTELVVQPNGVNVIRASEGRCPLCDQDARFSDNRSFLRCSNSKCEANGRLLKFVDGQFHYDPVLSDDEQVVGVEDPKPPRPKGAKK